MSDYDRLLAKALILVRGDAVRAEEIVRHALAADPDDLAADYLGGGR